MLNGKRITPLVCGSIAAYKAAELVRALRKAGAEVRVAMSPAATEFITPLTLQTLSTNPVSLSLFDTAEEAAIGHIELADEADLILVAPATADTIAKVRAGFADNIVHAVILATKAPVLFAPAMNVNMWNNIITQQNIRELRQLGMHFVDPEEGELACGWYGQGRFAETDAIVQAVEAVLAPKDLTGWHVMVSAGPTREPLDPVRFISNKSSGKMGYAIAKCATLRGAKVSLVSGPTALKVPTGVDCQSVETAVEMQEALLELLYSPASGPQMLVMAAAVADLRPAEVSGQKIKFEKSSNTNVKLQVNPDILAQIGAERAAIEKQSGQPLKVVGFAAETGSEAELLAFAQSKLISKNADLIVGNFAVDAFASESNKVWLVDKSGKVVALPQASKLEIAHKIISAARG